MPHFVSPDPASEDSPKASNPLYGQLDKDGLISLEINNMADDELAEDATVLEMSAPHRASLKTPSKGSDSETSTVSDPTSEEDYDAQHVDPSQMISGSKGGGYDRDEAASNMRKERSSPALVQSGKIDAPKDERVAGARRPQRRKSIPVRLEKTGQDGRYILRADDLEMREIIKTSLLHGSAARVDSNGKKRRSRFSDLVFTRQFTTFDRQNETTATSPFHGFFTLFWLGIVVMIIKVAALNWKEHGSVFGRNEVMTLMFHRDVMVLGLTDGAMCAATAFGLGLQKVIYRNWLNWNRSGWFIQSVWEAIFLAATLSWASYRRWPWTHNVFIVLHCLVMLMKQHSYAFYNGYLSEVFKRRNLLERKLKQLDRVEPARSPTSPTFNSNSPSEGRSPTSAKDGLRSRRRSLHVVHSNSDLRCESTEVASVAAAIESGAPLDLDQVQSFERIIKWEIEDLSEELKGKSSDGKNSYPHNLTVHNWAEYTVFPTVVYELEYPRQDSINWYYVAEKTLATFGCIGVMIVVSQAFIYPCVIKTVQMREQGMVLEDRLKEFPWILADLVFPFMMEYLLSWYVIWECILNVLAEVTRFADRGFYADWWNSTSWDQYARDWNRPVHNFLLRHVYHSSISTFRVSRTAATFITFFLSAVVHELVMWSIFRTLRGYLMIMQMMQLPLVMLSRTRLLKGRRVLGNVVFWVGIFTGPSFLCSLYLIL
ncbi:MAG: acyl-CoA/sterol acyltransferase [Chaenotheca gracillima]|nr:MAG: acyl-CoA/sterol acyltransferase [Chaenotheca gracillima]